MALVNVRSVEGRPEDPSPNGCDSTDSIASSSSDSERALKRRRPLRRAPRKRGKPTAERRKDEIGELQDQVKKLQDELSELKARSLSDARALMEVYVGGIERNNLALAGTQSLVAASTLSMFHGESAVPLATHIHLPIDAVARDGILRGMREQKLQSALRYMKERIRFMDLRVPHHQGQCFDYPNGDAASVSFEVIPLDSAFSLRDVYDEFLFWMRNQEITISEKMGTLTIRESDDLEDFTYGQSRLLTTVLDGVELESNSALFTRYEEGTPNQSAYAISALDFVDQDDLYPYRSTEIGRKEVTAAILIIESLTPSGDRAVSVCRWSFIRFRGPTGGMSTVQQSVVRDAMIGMCDIMPQLMIERLALRRAKTTRV